MSSKKRKRRSILEGYNKEVCGLARDKATKKSLMEKIYEISEIT